MNTFARSVSAAGSQARTYTANGAASNATSGSALVDLFFMIGASRGKDISGEFAAALTENKEIATRILLWSRDVRGGAGERQTFRKLINTLDVETQRQVLPLVPELGRWDDLLEITDYGVRKDAFALIKSALLEQQNGLCAKWMPRKGKVAAELREYLGLSPKRYRKLLVGLTKVVETQMCSKEWTAINYSHVPSVAMSRYTKAFWKNDKDRFGTYIGALQKGDKSVKVNASAMFPHDVIRGLHSAGSALANEQWKALPDFVGEGSFLPVCDVSGSMGTKISGSVSAMDISIGLGIYLAERNKSAFKDIIMTFSERPSLMKISGNLSQRDAQVRSAPWGMNTNLELAFRAILDHAKQNYVSQEDMPKALLILSDMEFDMCTRQPSQTLYENFKQQYEAAGYALPKVVFWNLNARSKNVPVTVRDSQTSLVSGYSPTIMQNVLRQQSNPLQMVLDTVMVPRYDYRNK